MTIILPAILKRSLILIVLFFHLTRAQGQSIVYHDSLSQYSYLLFGSTLLNADHKSTIPIGKQGTGFFVKIDSSIYFVTAKHTIANYLKNDDHKKDFPDSLNVYTHYSDPFNYITIPADWISDSIRLNEGLKDPDVFAYEVTNSMKNLKSDAIEISLLENDFAPGKANFNKIWIFGFPEIKNKRIGEVIQFTPPYRFESNNFHVSENFLNQIGSDRGIDYLNYEVLIKDAKITSAFAGFSGSPVFIQNRNSLKWQFMGIIVAANQIRNSIYVVKRDAVIRKILKVHDQNK